MLLFRNKLNKYTPLLAAATYFLSAITVYGASRPLPDLFQLSQDAATFVHSPAQLVISPEQQRQAAADYLRRHFSPWDGGITLTSKGELIKKWGRIVQRGGFGFNLLPLPKARLQPLLLETNPDNLYSVNKLAITQAAVDLRMLPTGEPIFEKVGRCAGGYPFDSLQNSRLKLGTPLLVSHYSKSGLYAYVIAAEGAGWVDHQSFALVDREFVNRWRSGEFAVISKFSKILRGSGGLVANSQLGSLLPVIAKNRGMLQVLLPVRDDRGYAKLYESLAYGHNEGISQFPFQFSQGNCAQIIGEMVGRPYGWGGYLGGLDCSAAVRDYFGIFGTWLPRDSCKQALVGERRLSLDGMDVLEKKRTLTSMAVPFATIAYMPGHIMLYLGIRNGEPLFFHEFWGIKTDHGAKVHLVGSGVITTGEIGQNLPGHGELLNNRITLLIWPVVPQKLK